MTDGKDRVTLMCLLESYFVEEIFTEGFKFSESGTYYAPPTGEVEDYIDYCKSLPQFPAPEVFGLHNNAAITKETNET